MVRHFAMTMDESTPCRNNLLGVKGVGELGTIGATPTVVNAVVDALVRAGAGARVDAMQMPFTPRARLARAARTGHEALVRRGDAACARRRSTATRCSARSLARAEAFSPFVLAAAYENQRPLADAYNRAIDTVGAATTSSSFVHDDVWVDDWQVAQRLRDALAAYDVVGVAGNRRRAPRQASWVFDGDQPRAGQPNAVRRRRSTARRTRRRRHASATRRPRCGCSTACSSPRARRRSRTAACASIRASRSISTTPISAARARRPG